MKKIILSVFLVPLLFSACTDENRGFALSDREKALVLSVRADTLFWGAAAEIDFDTVIDLSPALEKIDEAISLDPQNRQYYHKKAQYLEIAGRSDELSRVVRQLTAMGETGNYTILASLGRCFARQGQVDSARHYYRETLRLCRQNAFPDPETAYVDSAYAAHLEYYITGDREAALRKIRESADTLRMSEEHKSHLRQILADFDADQSFWQP